MGSKFLLFFILLFFFTKLNANPDSSADVKSAMEKFKGEEFRITKLELNKPIDLPKGLYKQVGTSEVIIGIDSLSFVGGNSVFGAFTYIYIPGLFKNPKEGLAFGARNITTNAGGFSAGNSAKIALISDHRIKISEKITLVLDSKEEGNYVEFDCNGFKSIGLKGIFEFDSSTFVSRGNTPNVQATFQASGSSLNDLIFTTSITPFEIKGVKDFVFTVKNASVDLSDMRNPSGFAFPSQYQSAYGGEMNLWRGFFLQELEVQLPPQLASKDGRTKITATNFLIDKQGVSGTITATNLLTLDKGSLGGWAFSLEKVGITLVCNNLSGGELGGQIKVPVLDSALRYSAMMKQEDWGLDYMFAIQPSTTISCSTFAADFSLNPSSIIKISSIKDRLIPEAILFGSIDFKHKLLNVKGVKFEKFHLTALEPYILGGIFSADLDKPGDISGFPLSLTELGFSFGNGISKFRVGAKVGLSKSASNVIAGDATIELIAKMESNSTNNSADYYTPPPSFKFDRIEVKRVGIECKTNAFSINGYVELYDNDPVYGNGFAGGVKFGMKSLKFLAGEIEVNAIFGKKDNYRYWYLDAYVPLPKVPLVPPVLYANMIMGGMYQNMSGPTGSDLLGSLSDTTSAGAAARSGTNKKYIPNPNSPLGIKLGIGFQGPDHSVMNGSLVAEVAFNSGGGVRYFTLDGQVFILSDKDTKGGYEFNGTINIKYDNTNSSFHALLRPRLNVFGVLKGANGGGSLGDVILHVDPNSWYFWAGRPLQPLGIEFASLATLSSYLQFGSKIDNMAPPPSALLEILGNNPDLIIRDDGITGNAKGIVFGARFGVSFDESFLIFYAKLALGAGFDVMIRDYGMNARCEGRAGNIGLNGWYASGQAFVYFKGEIGIQAMGGKFPILKLGLGALLQARLPNPFWARGVIGGEYSIMGGLISGQCDFEVELGEKCNIVGAKSVTDIPIISDIKPANGASKVDVFGIPQASFNLPVNKEFGMTDMDGNNRKFRIKVAEFSTTHNGSPVSGTTKLNAKQDVISFISTDVLPPNAPLKTYVKIQWEELKNGAWEIIKKENGNPDVQDSFTTYTTGDAPDFIPESNVQYSYPIRNQYNFLKNESPLGYIQLERGQPYLFDDPNNEWKLKARYKSPNKETKEINYSYNNSTREVLFAISPELSNETVYKLEFKKVPAVVRTEDRNSTTTTQTAGVVKIPKNTLSETVSKDVERDIYATPFKTSKYNSFNDKIDGSGSLQSMFDITTGNLTIIGGKYNASETIDEFELKGSGEYIRPLITATALSDNNWYSSHLYPLIYQNYTNNGNCNITHRDTSYYGLQPMKAISIYTPQSTNGYKLTDAQVNSSSAPTQQGQLMFAYKLAHEAYKDFFDLRNQAVNKFLNFGTSSLPLGAQKLITGQFPDMMTGNQYKLRLRYLLPGKNILSSFKDIIINY